MLGRSASVQLVLGICFLLVQLAGCAPNQQQIMVKAMKRTPLINAADAGNLAEVEALLAKDGDINAKDSLGETALYKAAEQGHAPVVDALLAKGADVDAEASYDGSTPLMAAARLGHTAVVDKLLAKGADANRKNKSGQDWFQIALENNHSEIVNKLITRGVDLKTAGDAPLSFAASKGDLGMVKSLLEKGAKPGGTGKGFFPLH